MLRTTVYWRQKREPDFIRQKIETAFAQGTALQMTSAFPWAPSSKLRAEDPFHSYSHLDRLAAARGSPWSPAPSWGTWAPESVREELMEMDDAELVGTSRFVQWGSIHACFESPFSSQDW